MLHQVLVTVKKPFIKMVPVPEPQCIVGNGKVLDVASYCRDFSVTNPFVVTDRVLRGLGLLDGMLEALKNADMPFTVFDDVQPDPDYETVRAGLERYRQSGCDGIIAFGGGSPIDCAKAIQLYESLFNQHPNFNFRGSFHNAAIGISHIANMAYCYQKLGQLDKANENVALLKQNLDELQLDKHIVPGAMLLKAKYALLVGKPHKAQHLVTEIKQLKWPLVWLINTDPAFK